MSWVNVRFRPIADVQRLNQAAPRSGAGLNELLDVILMILAWLFHQLKIELASFDVVHRIPQLRGLNLADFRTLQA